MKTNWGMLMFAVIFISVYFGGFAYVAWRINSGLSLKSPYSWYLFAALMALGLTTIAAFLASRYSMPFAGVIGNFGFIVMGVLGITATLLIVNDIANAANLFLKIKNFRYFSTMTALCLAGVFCLWSLINVAFFQKVKEITIPVKNLQTDSLRIVLLSDVHITAYASERKIRELVDRINSLNPDMIAIAGDLIDTDISETYQKYGLDKLQPKYGVYAVTGNHEYYSGLKKFFEACEKMNFIVLRNENFTVTDESGKEIITVAGVNDPQGQMSGFDTSDISKTFVNADKTKPVVFLSHRPELFDQAAAQGVNIIQLSGHLHDGQIPPIEMVVAFFKYNYGLYRNGDSYMYLTSGTRWWGPPMRLFNMSEIPVITLVKE